MTTETTTQLTRETLDIPYRHVTTHFIDGTWCQSHGQDTIEVIVYEQIQLAKEGFRPDAAKAQA